MDIDEALRRLTTQQQSIIINATNCDLPKDQIPVAQTEEGSVFYEELMREKAELPGVIFECPAIEDDPEDTEDLRKIMFENPVNE